MSSLEGAVVLVTGATRGIGRACAEALLQRGASVAITGQSVDAADATRDALQQSWGQRVSAHQFSQEAPRASDELIRSIKERWGRLDGLVANAGTHEAANVGMMRESTIDELVRTNVTGVICLLQSSTKLLRRSASPSVVLLGSIMGTGGSVGQLAYASTKAAVHGMVRPAARELGPIGVRVNAVAPGYVETDMVASMKASDRDAVINRTPLARFASPADVAAAVCFLLSDDSAFITGQILGVDGGLVV